MEKELLAAQGATDDQEYQAASNQALQGLLTEFNDRDADTIARRLEEISKALSQDLEGTIDLRFGGSVAKHTFVDGLSDVDSLVLLNKSELADLAPDDVKAYFADRLRVELKDALVSEGELAVTVRFHDVEIQLLPALKTKEGYRIANPSDNSWAHVRPQEFSRELTSVNEANGSKVVPVIKLAKAIVGNLPDRQRLKGYHVEALAVDVFRSYTGSLTLKDMLQAFFVGAASKVTTPLQDATGQSTHLDEYLGASGSLERRLVADTLDRIGRRIKNADEARSIVQVTALFDT